MLLCHRSSVGKDAVRQASPGGQLFVACVVVMMLGSVFSEALELTTLEVEIFATDVAFEFLGSIGLAHWDLIELVIAGTAMVLGVATLRTTGALAPKFIRSADQNRPDKIPI